MKNFLAILLFAPILFGHAQTDTLFANESHHLALFFPSPIRQAIAGSGNFTFSYNRGMPQHLGLLQAIPGKNSNLLVVTNDGQLYSFALQYRKKILQTYRFIGLGESVGSEGQTAKNIKSDVVMDSTPSKAPKKTSHFSRADYFENICAGLLNQDTKNLESKRKNGLALRLQNMTYHNFEVYLVFEIENSSGIDFELDYLKVFKSNGNTRRKSSFQKIRLVPSYE